MQHTPRSFSSQATNRHVANPLCKGRFVQMDAADATPLADMNFTRYYFRHCPRHWECSGQSWANAKNCESYDTEDAARALLLMHLTRSGNHNHNPQWKLVTAARNAEVSQEEVSGIFFVEPPGPAVKEEVDSPLCFDSVHW